MKRYRTPHSGFSLLELLVSASIIAILTIIGVVSYGSVNKRSRDVKRKSDVEQMRSALEMYRSDNGSYPAANSGSWGTTDGLSAFLVPGYSPVIPSDPQSETHGYYYTATNYDVATDKYYGYCICGYLETGAMASTCVAADIPGGSIPQACNYGLKNP